MNQAKRYGLLHIPESGLFYDKGRFFDGDGTPIIWDGIIGVHKWRQDADKRRKQLAKEEKRFVIIGFEPREKEASK